MIFCLDQSRIEQGPLRMRCWGKTGTKYQGPRLPSMGEGRMEVCVWTCPTTHCQVAQANLQLSGPGRRSRDSYFKLAHWLLPHLLMVRREGGEARGPNFALCLWCPMSLCPPYGKSESQWRGEGPPKNCSQGLPWLSVSLNRAVVKN